MTIYADYDFYKTQYLCGTKEKIASSEFDFYARKATLEINKRTFNKISDTNISDDVKMCCCEVAEILYLNNSENFNISSETLGDQSTTFVSLEEQEINLTRKIKKAVTNWLQGSNYLYRGA